MIFDDRPYLTTPEGQKIGIDECIHGNFTFQGHPARKDQVKDKGKFNDMVGTKSSRLQF